MGRQHQGLAPRVFSLSVPYSLSQFIEYDIAHIRRCRNHRCDHPLFLPKRKLTGAEMKPEDDKRANRANFILSVILIAGGLILSGLSLMQLSSRAQIQFAQTTQPEPRPSVPAGKSDGPAESKPGGTRPTTPAPEPARPDADAQKAGAKPALPPAPAEKTGEPIKN